MDIPVPFHVGKVRGTYDAGDNKLLVVASDRISVFDVVLPQLVPGKGKVLTTLTKFWLERQFSYVPNHMITTDMVGGIPESLRAIPDLDGRGMLVRRAQMQKLECIVRGYLYGSVTKEYETKGTATGIPLPAGLLKASQLPEPIFTPSTKADVGHDENISFAAAEELVDPALLRLVQDLSLRIYTEAAAYALSRGIILADTKFEFGLVDGQLTLCDEVLTPDSSRFWELETWEPGREPVSFDKQYVRNYYEVQHPEWNKTSPAPDLPDEIIAGTQEKYAVIQQVLTN
ncbi:MAG TPA: phosphoribosylaminoimidazolesuccinocarboxamide synthase [Candidatus Binatia bacterium]|jgi:phosphoribosylaminoimidazole-succinocarboxamide synthase|nr:phosphoribosylaminoimidazolesuccinocarboxamide synthase [Candidatus Binatia bacterium]